MTLDTFGKRLKRLLEERDMNQKELSEALHARGTPMSQGNLSAIITGGVKFPNPEIIVAMAATLETSTDYLLGATLDPRPVAERRDRPEAHTKRAEEAATALDAMDREHRDACLTMIAQFAALARQKRQLTQAQTVAQRLLANIETFGGEDALAKTLTMLENSLPGASVVSLRLLGGRQAVTNGFHEE